MLLVNNDFLQPHRCGASAEILTPRLICEKVEGFVFQEETNYFENAFSSDDSISMMSDDQCKTREGQYSSVLYFWKDTSTVE